MVITRHGRDYREDAAIAAAIAAVTAAQDGVAAAQDAEDEAIEVSIIELAENVDLEDDVVDDEDFVDTIEEEGDIGGGDNHVDGDGGGVARKRVTKRRNDISDGDYHGDGDMGVVAWERVSKKSKCEMNGDKLYTYFDNQLKNTMGFCPN